MDIYTKGVIKLASIIPYSERLKNPSISVTKRTPVCGSSITVDMTIVNDRISNFGQKVNACALGQASTSIVTKEIIGRRQEELEELLLTVKNMLAEKGPVPKRPYEEFKFLTPAVNYKNRHASILLILETIIEGFTKFKSISQ